MPLAFTQEDFLVHDYFLQGPGRDMAPLVPLDPLLVFTARACKRTTGGYIFTGVCLLTGAGGGGGGPGFLRGRVYWYARHGPRSLLGGTPVSSQVPSGYPKSGQGVPRGQHRWYLLGQAPPPPSPAEQVLLRRGW